MNRDYRGSIGIGLELRVLKTMVYFCLYLYEEVFCLLNVRGGFQCKAECRKKARDGKVDMVMDRM